MCVVLYVCSLYSCWFCAFVLYLLCMRMSVVLLCVHSVLSVCCFVCVRCCVSCVVSSSNITMPALSPTMTKGDIVEWLKKPGDQIKANEVCSRVFSCLLCVCSCLFVGLLGCS